MSPERIGLALAFTVLALVAILLFYGLTLFLALVFQVDQWVAFLVLAALNLVSYVIAGSDAFKGH